MAVEDIYTTASERVDASAGYAGDMTAEEAWRLVEGDHVVKVVRMPDKPPKAKRR